MTQDKMINPNMADADELRNLPGIGPALAERLIAARPFSDPQDLLRVTGISPAVLENIQPFLQFDAPAADDAEPADDPSTDADSDEIMISEAELENALADAVAEISEQLPDDTIEGDEVEAEEEKEGDVPAEPVDDTPAAPPPPEPAPQSTREQKPNFMSRAQVFWMAATFSFFTFIIAVALTLSIVSALNGGLRFASPGEVNFLRTQISDLQAQSETLDGDIDALRTRMDNFDAIGGRVTTLEDTVDALSADVESVSGEVETITADITAVSDSVENLRTDSNRFQAFLDGLGELLLGIAPEGSNE